ETTCLDGVCLAQLCVPGEQVCGEGVLLTCGADGLTWDRAPCAAGQVCLEGACAAPPMGGGIDCAPGEVLCGANGRVVCSEDGARYVETPCPAGQACFQSACVECVRDRDCPDDGACVDGACGAPPLVVITAALPAAQVGARYAAPLQAEHGAPPYAWAVEGDLPAGIALDGDTLAGVAEVAGEHPLTLVVTDADGAMAQADVTLRVVGEGLQITTARLPDGEEGEPYEVALGALGGEGRFGWFLVDGDLPPGLQLRGDGVITGVPAGVGPFEFTVRVVDSSTPPLFAERAFTIQIEIAPLRIVADQLLELFVTRIVTLPLITVIRDIPVPYRAELQAAGGLRPYTWREVELPPGLRGFIPQSGLPDGLELGEDGVIQGAVVDPDQIIELAIPFTQIVLTGFFFFAEVSDSQDPPATQQAVFVLPTLPIGN
ncbi:MAG: putative Ig domain-containing protein, partial [Myxococcales bacterium]|nr:putative Ig domain-containing protein [Myxococcales bacterium]